MKNLIKLLGVLVVGGVFVAGALAYKTFLDIKKSPKGIYIYMKKNKHLLVRAG